MVVMTADKEWLVDGKPALEHASNGWGKSVNGQISGFLPQAAGDSLMARKVRASLVKSTSLMRALGRPNREQVVTTRPADLTTLQALELNNGAEFVGYLNRGAAKLASKEGDMVSELYLDALSRMPSDLEKVVAGEVLGDAPTPERVADFLWTVLMLPEFQFNN